MQGRVTRENFKQVVDRRAHAGRQSRPVRILQGHFVATWMLAFPKDNFQRAGLEMRPGMVDTDLLSQRSPGTLADERKWKGKIGEVILPGATPCK